jgi:hypothetical protein
MRFADLRIRAKLTLIMSATGVCTLLLAVGAMVASEYSRTRDTITDELLTIADVVGWNCAAALAFGDQDAATQMLKSLAAKPGIEAAYLYGTEDKVFGVYRAADGLSPADARDADPLAELPFSARDLAFRDAPFAMCSVDGGCTYCGRSSSWTRRSA